VSRHVEQLEIDRMTLSTAHKNSVGAYALLQQPVHAALVPAKRTGRSTDEHLVSMPEDPHTQPSMSEAAGSC
jgi:hypothetical protein